MNNILNQVNEDLMRTSSGTNFTFIFFFISSLCVHVLECPQKIKKNYFHFYKFSLVALHFYKETSRVCVDFYLLLFGYKQEVTKKKTRLYFIFADVPAAAVSSLW